MIKQTEIDLLVLLPEHQGGRDACVARLETLIGVQPGITGAHVDRGRTPPNASPGMRCDRAVLPSAQVDQLARTAGAQVTECYGHAVPPIRAVGGEDAARRIENALLGMDRVVSASVNLAAQRARIEFDRERTSVDEVRNGLERSGCAAAPLPHPRGVAPAIAQGSQWRRRRVGRHKIRSRSGA